MLPAGYNLFDDDGENKQSISSGKYELINFKATPTEGGYRFSITSNNGSFKGKPTARTFHLIIHNAATNYKITDIEGAKITRSADDDMGNTVVEINFNGRPASFNVMQ